MRCTPERVTINLQSVHRYRKPTGLCALSADSSGLPNTAACDGTDSRGPPLVRYSIQQRSPITPNDLSNYSMDIEELIEDEPCAHIALRHKINVLSTAGHCKQATNTHPFCLIHCLQC